MYLLFGIEHPKGFKNIYTREYLDACKKQESDTVVLRSYLKKFHDGFKKLGLNNGIEYNEKYGKQYRTININLEIKDNMETGKLLHTAYSKVHEGAGVYISFSNKNFLMLTEAKRIELLKKQLKDSLSAIKQNKKGDFNVEKLIADIQGLVC